MPLEKERLFQPRPCRNMGVRLPRSGCRIDRVNTHTSIRDRARARKAEERRRSRSDHIYRR